MENCNPDCGPVEILRSLNAGEVTESDVIRWAEQQVANGSTLGQETAVFDLALLSTVNDNSSTVPSLLEKLIAVVVDFSITEEQLEQARHATKTIIRDGKASSIRRENCIEFIIGYCPQIAAGVTKERQFFGGYEPGLYSELSAFNEFVVCAIKEDSDDLTQATQCLELLFELGNAEVREAATVGVLEGVTNFCIADDITFTRFVKQLLPKSRRAYEQLDKFWGTDYKLP